MTSQPPIRLRPASITISGPDPIELARFYAKLLGVDVAVEEPAPEGLPPVAGWAQVKADPMTLNFEYEAQWQDPAWPAVHGRPTFTQHLDIWVDDVAAAVEWATACGARLADSQFLGDRVKVMIDPVGHPFCLFR